MLRRKIKCRYILLLKLLWLNSLYGMHEFKTPVIYIKVLSHNVSTFIPASLVVHILSSVNGPRWCFFLLQEQRCGIVCQATLHRPRRCPCSRTGWRHTCSATATKLIDFEWHILFFLFPFSCSYPSPNDGPCNSLVRLVNLPTGPYILLAFLSFFFIFHNDHSENNYLRIYWTNFRNRFFFTKWKRFGVHAQSGPIFPISQRMLPWQTILWKNGKLPSFIALAFRNGMGYRYLNMRINSINDASISCKNFVNIGPVTPELTELCELLVRHGEKWRI